MISNKQKQMMNFKFSPVHFSPPWIEKINLYLKMIKLSLLMLQIMLIITILKFVTLHTLPKVL